MNNLLNESIKALEDIRDMLDKNQCYACNHEFIKSQGDFATNILTHCIEVLKMQPQIVMCKDCKHYEPDKYFTGQGDCNGSCNNLVKVSDNWFCPDGERKDTL